MSAERFIDTNVLVYLFDHDEPDKAARSRELLAAGDNVLSTQVLQEFYVVVTGKLAPGLPPPEAVKALRHAMRVCGVVAVAPETVLAAAQRGARASLSFWDALIVETALGAGCRVLFTEDLQHGQVFDGRLMVHNPYIGMSTAGLACDGPGPETGGVVHRPRYTKRSSRTPRAATPRRQR